MISHRPELTWTGADRVEGDVSIAGESAAASIGPWAEARDPPLARILALVLLPEKLHLLTGSWKVL